MFKSCHKIILSTMLAASIVSTGAMASENKSVSHTYDFNNKKVIDGGVTYPEVNGKRSSYYVNTEVSKGGFNLGRKATDNEIKAWNIDAMPDGTGLPEGRGTVEEGDAIYEAKCASCHFDFGTGGAGYPALQQGNAYTGVKSLKNQRTTDAIDGPIRVFGTYWPYASTLWWYIKTGMPHPAPMSLTNDEVYSLVAYIVSINELEIDGATLEDDTEFNREMLLKIVMPNKDGFEPKIDGPKGLDNAREYFNDFSNYGNGKRCMKDCFEGEPVLARISGAGISDYDPPISNEKSLPVVKEDKSAEVPGAKEYQANCSVCHGTDTMGAPMVGNKDAWAKVVAQGMETVYEHAIKGKGGMPPKGGTQLDEAKIKEIIDYMVNQSK